MDIASLKHIYFTYKKYLMAMSVLLFINIALQCFISLVQSDQLTALHSSAQQLQTKDNQDKIRMDSARAEKASNDLTVWRSSIYSKRDFARYIGELLDLVNANNLTIVSITYKPAIVDTEKLLSYQIKLSMNGKYKGIKKLLGDLQKQRNVTAVNDVALDNSSMTEESVLLNLTITTFFRTEEQ